MAGQASLARSLAAGLGACELIRHAQLLMSAGAAFVAKFDRRRDRSLSAWLLFRAFCPVNFRPRVRSVLHANACQPF